MRIILVDDERTYIPMWVLSLHPYRSEIYRIVFPISDLQEDVSIKPCPKARLILQFSCILMAICIVADVPRYLDT